jgi:hypothetical protein
MLTHRNTTVNRETIAGLFDRLHKAGYTQGSVYPRNVLVQPGPLTQLPAERSFDNPSYRIIDFGRGKTFCWMHEEDWDAIASCELKRVYEMFDRFGEYLRAPHIIK